MVQCKWSKISPTASEYPTAVGGGKTCATENSASQVTVYGPWLPCSNTKR